MGISGIENMTIETARQNLAVFAGIRRGQKLRFDPTTLRFTIDGKALIRSVKNWGMGAVNSSVTNDATFSTPIIYSFSKIVMEGNFEQATIDNAIHGLEVLEQTYRNEQNAHEKHRKMSDVLKQVHSIVSDAANVLLNQFQKLGQVTDAEIQLITKDQNAHYLQQIFYDDQILNLAATTFNPNAQDNHEMFLTEKVTRKLKAMDPSLLTDAGMDIRTWFNALPKGVEYSRSFQTKKASFLQQLELSFKSAEAGIHASTFIHYFPPVKSATKLATWRVYLCPRVTGFGKVIEATNLYLIQYSMLGGNANPDPSVGRNSNQLINNPVASNLNPGDHGLVSFKHAFDTSMRFTNKDRMVFYMADQASAIRIGEFIYQYCSSELFDNDTAATINTTKVKPGVYIGYEPGHVSTGMDHRESKESSPMKLNQLQQSVTLLSSNLISMALVNWHHDYALRTSSRGRIRGQSYNSLETIFRNRRIRDQEYQVFLKYLAVAMKAYKNQLEGQDMVNNPIQI